MYNILIKCSQKLFYFFTKTSHITSCDMHILEKFRNFRILKYKMTPVQSQFEVRMSLL